MFKGTAAVAGLAAVQASGQLSAAQTDPTGRYQPPHARELAEFRDQLQILGAPVVRRYSGGKDIGAACGTLEASSYGGTLIPPPARFPRAAQTG